VTDCTAALPLEAWPLHTESTHYSAFWLKKSEKSANLHIITLMV